MIQPLSRHRGLALFAGKGAWGPRPTPLAAPSNDALLCSNPTKILLATKPEEVAPLLEEVERAQQTGNYVAGYLAYEAGTAFGLATQWSQGRDTQAGRDNQSTQPLAWMAVYEPASVVVIPVAVWNEWLAGVDVSQVATALSGVKPALSISRQDYIAGISKIRQYIGAGDTYQVNYTVRGHFDLLAAPSATIDPLDYFLALVARQSVPYAAFLDLGDSQILSLSPELLLRRDGPRLESRPMKGTRPRGASQGEDVTLAYQLVETAKERAENLMIVDMVRNDLGRVCRVGSVAVPSLYGIEPYRTVWQMVSTVTGELSPQISLLELIRAVFPGASVTGAPKHHTMELIAALETEPRGVYTGTVGLFRPDGDFTANVAIRTLTHRDGHCRLGIGSGIVWDAQAVAEYDETLLKATFATSPAITDFSRGKNWCPDPAAILGEARLQEGFYLFETLLLRETVGGKFKNSCDLNRYALLQEHLERLSKSAQAFGLPLDIDGVRDRMAALAGLHPELLVVRLQLDTTGHFHFSTRVPPPPPKEPVTLLVSPFRTDPDDPLLFHKTSLRGFYHGEHQRGITLNCFDALFVNRLDHVTEGAISNFFARFGSEWVTPPLTDGVLPGLWRTSYLAEKQGTERSLTLAELRVADELVVGNSVRGTVPVKNILTQMKKQR